MSYPPSQIHIPGSVWSQFSPCTPIPSPLQKATLGERTQPTRKGGRPPLAGGVSKYRGGGAKRAPQAKQLGSDADACDGAGAVALSEPASPSWGGLVHYGRKLMELTPPSSKRWRRGEAAVGAAVTLAGWELTPGAAMMRDVERLALGERTAGSPSGILGIKLEFLPSP